MTLGLISSPSQDLRLIFKILEGIWSIMAVMAVQINLSSLHTAPILIAWLLFVDLRMISGDLVLSGLYFNSVKRFALV